MRVDGLAELGRQIHRHPFFYEPTLVIIAFLVPAVLARQLLPPIAGIAGWLMVTAAGFALWALIRLFPLVGYVPEADRDRTRILRSLSTHPLGSLVFGFIGGYGLVRSLNLLVPAMGVPPHFAGLVGGVVVGLPLGASYWISAFGYAARRARWSRSRPAV